MDYAYAKIVAAEEGLRRSIREGGNHPELREELAEHLHACSEALRAVEWSDSSDTAPADWVPLADKLLAPLRAARQ